MCVCIVLCSIRRVLRIVCSSVVCVCSCIVVCSIAGAFCVIERKCVCSVM